MACLDKGVMACLNESVVKLLDKDNIFFDVDIGNSLDDCFGYYLLTHLLE